MKLNATTNPPAMGITVLVDLDDKKVFNATVQFRRKSLHAGVYTGTPEDATHPSWRVGVFDENSGLISSYCLHSSCVRGWIPMPLVGEELIEDDFGVSIDEFKEEYFFLSNFYPSPITFPLRKNFNDECASMTYPTVEHAFQAFKTLDPEAHIAIARAPTPSEAKKMGRRVELRPDWEDIKVDLMRGLIEAKFAYGSMLAEKLQNTAGCPLIEGNTWGDTFWGVCNDEGQNWLGQLLMERRDALLAMNALKRKSYVDA